MNRISYALIFLLQAWQPVTRGQMVHPGQSGTPAHREGRDWKYLSEWFARDLEGEEADRARSLGTFWNVKKVHNFPGKLEPKAYQADYNPKEHNVDTISCVLVFYYPGYWKELENTGDIPDFWTYYERPLAVAPMCGPAALPPDNTDFPRGPKGERDTKDSIVFHSYWVEDVKTDLYYVWR